MTKSLLLKSLPAFCLAVASAPLSVLASAASEVEMELAQAHNIVQSYRELRDSCANGNYDKRRECVRALSSASEEYRSAKNAIAKHEQKNNTKIASY
ncbi:hypothetical protein [Marinagarivorans algicola]|uniref:hypothetical protein n=1 Tax=Marinagarivorans algicola TaxID=1513270 RepID=UPI0006B9FCF3|nr:hypothetical protein [Marinagarivorans algicola]